MQRVNLTALSAQVGRAHSHGTSLLGHRVLSSSFGARTCHSSAVASRCRCLCAKIAHKGDVVPAFRMGTAAFVPVWANRAIFPRQALLLVYNVSNF